MFRDRNPSSVYLAGINQYVPGMQYASALVHGQPCEFSLGSPVYENDVPIFLNAVSAQAVAGTEVAVAANVQLADSRYGRNLRFAFGGDPGNSNVVDIYGFDYLGQPMIERFTGTSGSTAMLYGKKAFYKVTKSKIVTPSTNASTFSVRAGSRLGLPFKGDVVAARENDVQVALYNRDFFVYADRAAALAVAGGSNFLRMPCPGFVKSLIGIPNGGGSTNDPVITVERNGVAIIGLTVTIDTSSPVGAVVTSNPTTPGYNANNCFTTDSVVELVGSAAASAGSDRVGIIVTPTQFVLPDLTDAATGITGDPRGTYEALRTLDGSEIIVSLVGNNAVNADGNGGLMGIRHYRG